MHIFKRIIMFTLILCVLFTNLAYASPQDMIFDGVSYIEAADNPATFKADFWRTGTQESNIILPLREQWTFKVGKSTSQPASVDNNLFILADNKLLQLSLKSKAVSGSITIQTSSTPSNSHITVIKNKDGWFNSDKLDRLLFGSREGIFYCIKVKEGVMDKSWIDWSYTAEKGKSIDMSPAFFFDAMNNKPYVIFGVDKNLYILDTEGNLVHKTEENGKVTTSPLIFKTVVNSTYSEFLYGVKGQSGKTYLSGGVMINGQFQEDPTFNKNKAYDYGMFGISCIGTEAVMLDGKADNILVTVDENGNIYGISKFSAKLLWKISKYASDKPCVEGSTLSLDTDNVYAVISDYKQTGKAKFVAIDYRKAVELGRSNPESSEINSAVLYESGDNEFTGKSETSPSILRVVSKKENGEIGIRGRLAFVGDKGSKNNFRVFYTTQAEEGEAERVKDAFQTVDAKTKDITSSNSMTLPGGAASETLYSDGYLYIVDGQGTLHSYSGIQENNLAVLNIKNSSDYVQKEDSYTVTVDIANYSAKKTDPVKIQFTITTPDGSESKIDQTMPIPEDGLAANLKYTVPASVGSGYFSIRCEINPEDDSGTRVVPETSYTDNIQELRIKIADVLDAGVRVIPKNDYEEKTWVTTRIVFENNSEVDLANIPIEITKDGVKLTDSQVPQKITIAKKSTFTVPVTWYTGDLGNVTLKKVKFTARIILPNDRYSSNNFKKTYMTVKKDLPDLEIVKISPSAYKENTRVNTIFTVRNNGGVNYTDSNRITLNQTVNGHTISKKIDLPAHSERNVLLAWTTPSAGTKVTISGVINPENKPAESDRSNNEKSISAVISKDNPPPYINNDYIRVVPPPAPCKNNTATWTETRDNWKYEYVYAGKGSKIDPKTKKEVTWNIYEWKWNNYPYSKTFHAKLSISVTEIREVYGNGKDKINPAAMKSGYGIETTVKTSFETDYDRSTFVFGAQHLYVYLPEYQYTFWESLQSSDEATLLNNTWRFRVNYDSGLNRREHYIPVQFPDNTNYILYFKATGAAAGESGDMDASTTRGIYINGSMYQDDATGGSR